MKKDLKDVTFCIPIKIDHRDRLENLSLVVDFLNHNFDTNIIVYEEDVASKVDVTDIPSKITAFMFGKNSKPNFHRTRMLNSMFKAAKTPIVVNYDADVLLPIKNYTEAADKIRTGSADHVYPYDGRFREVQRDVIQSVRENFSIDDIEFDATEYIHDNSVGGACFSDLIKYKESGFENEKFVSWGYEDLERLERWQKLGMRVERVPGFLVHFLHNRDFNSSPANPFLNANMLEWQKIRGMNRESLLQYITTWT